MFFKIFLCKSEAFLWINPIFQKYTDEQAKKDPYGVIVYAFLLNDILADVLERPEWRSADVRIYEHPDMLGEHQIYGSRGAIKANMYWPYQMTFGEKQWHIVISPGNKFYFELLSWGQAPILLTGLMLSMIFSCFLLLMMRYNSAMDAGDNDKGIILPEEIQSRIAEAETSKNEFLVNIVKVANPPITIAEIGKTKCQK